MNLTVGNMFSYLFKSLILLLHVFYVLNVFIRVFIPLSTSASQQETRDPYFSCEIGSTAEMYMDMMQSQKDSGNTPNIR
jgi:hypothetical protein